MASKAILGLDLGQQSDYTVLSIVNDDRKGGGSYDLVYLKKYKLKTSYVSIVRDIGNMVKESYALKGSRIIVDATGVGRPVVDMFLSYGVQVISATITGGSSSSWKTKNEVTIPKKEIVSCLQIVLQNKVIKIASGLDCIEDIKREFLNFKASISSNARASFNARAGYHDDIVMSLGLAIWLGEFISSSKNKIRVVAGS